MISTKSSIQYAQPQDEGVLLVRAPQISPLLAGLHRSSRAIAFFQQVQNLFAQSIILFFQLSNAAFEGCDLIG
jgi:hypothetical protein